MKLSNEQKHVVKEVLKKIKSQQITKVAGYAGTGKTVVVSCLNQILKNFAFCAFTGKAADVLRKKRIEAGTIHSLIYQPQFDLNGDVEFVLADSVPFDGFVVDEASMVSQDLYNDLCSFRKPIIFVGDHGQLEPIGSDINLMEEPDYCLETIHRNAGEIAYFGEWIRKGNIPSNFPAKEKVIFIDRFKTSRYLTQVDQVICAFNKTRVALNEEARMQLINSGFLTPKSENFDFNRPLANDKIMCLRNSRLSGLFNGMQGIVTSISPDTNLMEFVSDNQKFEVRYDPSQFFKEKYNFSHDKDDPHPFDFAYAVSCHKAQGSEWSKVLVKAQYCDKWDMVRWFYSAATRAKEQLIWAY